MRCTFRLLIFLIVACFFFNAAQGRADDAPLRLMWDATAFEDSSLGFGNRISVTAEPSSDLKTLKGEVLASSPTSMAIRVIDQGKTEVIALSMGLKTKFVPFRRPGVGEKVEVEYRDENGGKFAYTVRIRNQ